MALHVRPLSAEEQQRLTHLSQSRTAAVRLWIKRFNERGSLDWLMHRIEDGRRPTPTSR